MTRIVVLLCACLIWCHAEAETLPKPVKFDMRSANVAQVVQLIYSEAIATPYVLDPEILTDARSVSFRYASDKGDIRIFVKAFLDSLGYVIQSRNGIDFITKRSKKSLSRRSRVTFTGPCIET